MIQLTKGDRLLVTVVLCLEFPHGRAVPCVTSTE